MPSGSSGPNNTLRQESLVTTNKTVPSLDLSGPEGRSLASGIWGRVLRGELLLFERGRRKLFRVGSSLRNARYSLNGRPH